jgi:hypothetical protein
MLEVQTNQLLELTKIVNVLARTASVDSVSKYRGEPAKFRLWIKEIDKTVRVSKLLPEEAVAIAYQSAVGPPSDYIGRYLEAHQPAYWPELKLELQTHFAEVSDPQHALYVLRKITQGKENAQVFGERVVELAEDAWPGQNLNAPLIQAQVVDVFIDGLGDKLIAKKVLRAATGTLLEAIRAATREQDWSRRFELRGLGGTGTVNRNPRHHGCPRPRHR